MDQNTGADTFCNEEYEDDEVGIFGAIPSDGVLVEGFIMNIDRKVNGILEGIDAGIGAAENSVKKVLLGSYKKISLLCGFFFNPLSDYIGESLRSGKRGYSNPVDKILNRLFDDFIGKYHAECEKFADNIPGYRKALYEFSHMKFAEDERMGLDNPELFAIYGPHTFDDSQTSNDRVFRFVPSGVAESYSATNESGKLSLTPSISHFPEAMRKLSIEVQTSEFPFERLCKAFNMYLLRIVEGSDSTADSIHHSWVTDFEDNKTPGHFEVDPRVYQDKVVSTRSTVSEGVVPTSTTRNHRDSKLGEMSFIGFPQNAEIIFGGEIVSGRPSKAVKGEKGVYETVQIPKNGDNPPRSFSYPLRVMKSGDEEIRFSRFPEGAIIVHGDSLDARLSGKPIEAIEESHVAQEPHLLNGFKHGDVFSSGRVKYIPEGTADFCRVGEVCFMFGSTSQAIDLGGEIVPAIIGQEISPWQIRKPRVKVVDKL